MASTAANWSDQTIPVEGDSVIFDGTSGDDCTWDLDVLLGNWTQTIDYTGTVTFRTRFAGQGSFSNLVIACSAELLGGVWTHPANTGGDTETDRLAVEIGGNFTLGAGGMIDVKARGFASQAGPGGGVQALRSGKVASHGGKGGFHDSQKASLCYGSLTRPAALGSGGSAPGGGAVWLMVGGTATLAGNIRADGEKNNDERFSGGAGGSIFLQAAAVTGAGVLTAHGGSGYYTGGGGRIAVVATNAESLGSINTAAAAGNPSIGGRGTAGTVYRETIPGGQKEGVLIIDQQNQTPQSTLYTPLRWPLGTTPHAALPQGELANATLQILNKASVRVLADMRTEDLQISADSTLHLHGYTLYLKTVKPVGFPDLSMPTTAPVTHPSLGGGALHPEGGRVLWNNTSASFKVPISSGGPQGSISNYDADTYYDFETNLVITAVPAHGYTFLRWIGSLPSGADPLEAELALSVQPELHLRALFVSTAANTYTWVGGVDSDMRAGTSGNWYPQGVPQTNDHIELSGAAFTALTWDSAPLWKTPYADNYERLADWVAHSADGGIWHGDYPRSMHEIDIDWDILIEPASWKQTEWFSGRVTFPIRYPACGAYTNLVIHGDVVLDGGVWSHPPNSGSQEATDRLAIDIKGDFTLGADSMIDVDARGFAEERGPGAGITGQRSGKAASHGGQGGYHGNQIPSPCYGSISRPEWPGSGALSRGGGALWLIARGTATLDGIIRADGQGSTHSTAPNRYSGGAGGSILLQAATVLGRGSLTALGGWGYYTGGGGRIALVATNGLISKEIITETLGGAPATVGRGTTGTAYRESVLDGQTNRVLLVDQGHTASQGGINTELPPVYETYDIHPVLGGEFEDVTLIVTNGAMPKLSSSLRIGDFTWISDDSMLDLDGYLLYIKAAEPLGTFPADYGNGTIAFNGGDIIWDNAAADALLIVSSGPNGDTLRDPELPDDLYPFESEVTITAIPSPGFSFLFWQGVLPESATRTTNPLTVIMDQKRELHAIFASDDPMTRTWIGDGPDTLASTAQNWYPATAPTAGIHVVFNANSDKPCDWDLDVALASWTQHEGYTTDYNLVDGHFGRVFFWTQFPAQGTFTNLRVNGDVVLHDGTWSQRVNTGGETATDRLSLTVGGDFLLQSNAVIDVAERGFSGSRGPGAGASNLRGGYGASYGGPGENNTNESIYGSIMSPVDLGSSASVQLGGGALFLDVGGSLVVDGVVLAQGASRYPKLEYSAAAGGSVWLSAASITGQGVVNANGGTGYYCGGGGRVALISRAAAAEPADITLSAYPGITSRKGGGRAGTIYLETATSKRVIIDQNQLGTVSDLFTLLPGELVPGSVSPNSRQSPWSDTTLVARNGAFVGLAEDMLLFDLFLEDTSRISLQGHTLTLRAPYHDDWGNESQVDDAGGKIIWIPQGTILLLR